MKMSSRFGNTSRTVPARFPKIGTVVEGTVLSITDAPVPAFENGKPVGPKVDVLTGETETQADVVLDVNGVKTLIHTRGGVSYGIATFLEGSPLDDLHEGDFLSIKYVADEPMGEGLDPAKVYEVRIVSASASSVGVTP